MNNTFSAGDLIEASKPKTGERYRARLHEGRISGELVLGQAGNIPRLRKDGFTFEVIEKAAPALPTEAGVYLSKYGRLWELRANEHGDPEWFQGNSFASIGHVSSHTPFTRLEPVADTAKKVLDDVAAYWEFGAPSNVTPALTSAAKNFGVVYE